MYACVLAVLLHTHRRLCVCFRSNLGERPQYKGSYLYEILHDNFTNHFVEVDPGAAAPPFSPPPSPKPPCLFCFWVRHTQERRDAALRGQFTVKRRPQASAAGGAHPLAETGGMFDRKPKVVLDPRAVRPLLNVASLPSRKPVGVYGRERR